MPEENTLLITLAALSAHLRAARRTLLTAPDINQLLEIDVLLSVAEAEIRRLAAEVASGAGI